nr:LysE family transporter [Salinigranum marinum]
MTLANPVTILAFVGVFAALGVGLTGAYLDVAVLVVGVFAGTAFWWLCLAAVVDRFRGRLAPSHLRRVNQFAGVTIAGFGLLALWSAGCAHAMGPPRRTTPLPSPPSADADRLHIRHM